MISDNRNQLIDALRAFAVLAMIVYHFAWDLGLFNVVDPVIVNSGRWKLFAVSIGSSFLFLSGISFWLASSNGINFKKFTFRLFFLIVAALIVSLGTYVADSQTFVFFGIFFKSAFCQHASTIHVFFYVFPLRSEHQYVCSRVFLRVFFCSRLVGSARNVCSQKWDEVWLPQVQKL